MRGIRRKANTGLGAMHVFQSIPKLPHKKRERHLRPLSFELVALQNRYLGDGSVLPCRLLTSG
jgi:hypothetical protein